jgi:hypothetical protein
VTKKQLVFGFTPPPPLASSIFIYLYVLSSAAKKTLFCHDIKLLLPLLLLASTIPWNTKTFSNHEKAISREKKCLSTACFA